MTGRKDITSLDGNGACKGFYKDHRVSEEPACTKTVPKAVEDNHAPRGLSLGPAEFPAAYQLRRTSDRNTAAVKRLRCETK